jgi:hypothetical protein
MGDLNRNQKRALEALLREPTVKDAASACDLTQRTLYRYLSDDDFRDELHRRQDAIVGATTAALVELGGEAVKALQTSLATLTEHQAANLADFIEIHDDGTWSLDLKKAEAEEKLHLVKKLWRTEGGEERIEIHDVQLAAARLGRQALSVIEERRKAVELDQLAERVAAIERRLQGGEHEGN